MTIGQRLDLLGLKKKRVAILAKRLKKAREEYTLLQRETFEALVDEGYDPGESAVKRKGQTFTPHETAYARIQDKDRLIEHLRETDPAMISEGINKAWLNQLVREALDNGEPMPPGLGFDMKQTIQTRGLTKNDNDLPDAPDEAADGESDPEWEEPE